MAVRDDRDRVGTPRRAFRTPIATTAAPWMIILGLAAVLILALLLFVGFSTDDDAERVYTPNQTAPVTPQPTPAPPGNP